MISNYIEDHQQELTSSCDDLSLLAIHHWPNIIQHWHVLNLDMDLNMFIDIILALPSAQQAYVHRITPDELRETCNNLVYGFLCNLLVFTDFSIMPVNVDVCTNKFINQGTLTSSEPK